MTSNLTPPNNKRPIQKTQSTLPAKYSDYVLYVKYLDNYPSLLPHPDTPATIQEALNSIDAPKWKATMDDEYNSLLKNNTRILTDLPPERSVVSCKVDFEEKI